MGGAESGLGLELEFRLGLALGESLELGLVLELEERLKLSTNMSLPTADLKMAHEQQTKSLEEEFEKIRLSLQVNDLPTFKSSIIYS